MEELKELSQAELVEDLCSTLPDKVSPHVVDILLDKNSKLSEENTKDWLQWCQKSEKVKITSCDVPHGILPQGVSLKLHDVKVGGAYGGHGPDDKIYNNDAEIRDKVARGNTVMEIHDSNTGLTSHDMVVFALKKFTGGMGDEDEDQPENDLVWQRYFLKPLDEVSKVVCMIKENGEAAHVSVRLIEGKFYFIAGSKNVHLIFRNQHDIDLYKDSRYMVAKTVAEAWLREINSITKAKLPILLNFLHLSKLTAIFEILCPDYQHVVDLSHLQNPKLKFLTLTTQYTSQGNTDQGNTGLCALPPHLCIDFARSMGLDTANYEIVEAKDAEKRMVEIRGGYGYEGEVMYFLDKQDMTVGLLKKKTAWYVLCRAIREKVSNAFSAFKKNPGGWTKQLSNSHLVRIDNRVDQIRKWLELSESEANKWKKLGKDFQNWLITNIQSDVKNMDKYAVRGKFPQLWKSFLNGTSISDRIDNLEEENSQEAEQAEEEEKYKIEDARTGSPIIHVDNSVDKIRPYIATCIIRNVDLLGKNMKKLLAAMHKAHARACKDRKLATIGLHDMDKISGSKLVYTVGKPTITPIGYSQKHSVEELIAEKVDSVLKYKHLVEDMEEVPFIKNGETVISVPPLLNCDETKISEETENIFIEITSDKDEETANTILVGILLQIYHLGIGLDKMGKYIHIERGVVEGDDETRKIFPIQLPSF